MKYKKLILGVLQALFIIGLITYYAVFVAPHKLNIREETLSSNKIDESFDGFTIAYFSDLHFGTFIGGKDLDKCVDTINSVKPDIVLFGGDLIDNFYEKGINEDSKNLLIEKLSTIDASINKYAVLGEQDERTSDNKLEIIDILNASGFTVLDNENVQIFNGGNSSINIIGIDNVVNGQPNIVSSYEGISEGSYTLAFSHCPDIFEKIKTNLTDYVLAGHSHKGQIYIPIFNRLYRKAGCIEYFSGKHRFNNTFLDITSGVGLENKSIRLFADAEVVFYKLKAK